MVICFLVYEVISFPFMTKKGQDKNGNVLRMKRAGIRSIFHPF